MGGGSAQLCRGHEYLFASFSCFILCSFSSKNIITEIFINNINKLIAIKLRIFMGTKHQPNKTLDERDLMHIKRWGPKNKYVIQVVFSVQSLV